MMEVETIAKITMIRLELQTEVMMVILIEPVVMIISGNSSDD